MVDQLQTVDHARQVLFDLALQFGPKLLTALAIGVAGLYVAAWVGRLVERSLHRLHLDPPVRQLGVRIVRLSVVAMFAIMALQNLGVELLPLIAGLGVAGAGVALAMQGVLGNIVAGLTIIFTRPFRVGDYIAIVGEDGLVDAISLFTTTLSHVDRSHVVIPNRKIVGEILHNYGGIRQLEVQVGIGYDNDLDAVLAAARSVLLANARVLRDPEPVLGVVGLGQGAITISLRPWVASADYVAAQGEIGKALVEALRREAVAFAPWQVAMAGAQRNSPLP